MRPPRENRGDELKLSGGSPPFDPIRERHQRDEPLRVLQRDVLFREAGHGHHARTSASGIRTDLSAWESDRAQEKREGKASNMAYACEKTPFVIFGWACWTVSEILVLMPWHSLRREPDADFPGIPHEQGPMMKNERTCGMHGPPRKTLPDGRCRASSDLPCYHSTRDDQGRDCPLAQRSEGRL